MSESDPDEGDTQGSTASSATDFVPEQGAPELSVRNGKVVVVLRVPFPLRLLCPKGCSMKGYTGDSRFNSLARKHLQPHHNWYNNDYQFVCRFCGMDAEEARKTESDPGKDDYGLRVMNNHIKSAHEREMKNFKDRERKERLPCTYPKCKLTFVNAGKLQEHIHKIHSKKDVAALCKEKFPFGKRSPKLEFQGNMVGEHSPPTRKGLLLSDTDDSLPLSPELSALATVIKQEPKTPPKPRPKRSSSAKTKSNLFLSSDSETDDFGSYQDSPAKNTRSASRQKPVPKKPTKMVQRKLSFSTSDLSLKSRTLTGPLEDSGFGLSENTAPSPPEIHFRLDLAETEFACIQYSGAKGWLSDQVIYTYLSHSVLPVKPRTLLVDSLILQVLDESPFPDFRGKRRQMTNPEFREDWSFVVIPLHLFGNHWSLAIGTPQVITYYDSMRVPGDKKSQGSLELALGPLRKILRGLGAPDAVIESAAVGSHFTQKDTWSCGPAICMLAERHMKGESLKFTADDVKKWRAETFQVFSELFRKQTHYEESQNFSDLGGSVEILEQTIPPEKVDDPAQISKPSATVSPVLNVSGKVSVETSPPSTNASEKARSSPLITQDDKDGGGGVVGTAATAAPTSLHRDSLAKSELAPARGAAAKDGSVGSVKQGALQTRRGGKEQRGTRVAATAGGGAAGGNVNKADGGESARKGSTKAPAAHRKAGADKKAPQKAPPKLKYDGSKGMIRKMVAKDAAKDTLIDRARQHILEKLAKSEKWEAFEEACFEFTAMLRALTKGRDPFRVDVKIMMSKAKNSGIMRRETPDSGGKHEAALGLNTSEAMRMYRTKKKAFMKTILEEPSQECEIPLNELEAYFGGLYKEKPSGDFEPFKSVLSRPEGMDKVFSGAFKLCELNEVLKRTKDTAPGPDGVRYSDMKRFDPERKILMQIFQRCFDEQKIPEHWKKAQTILIYKKGDRNCPDNWRPIALSNTIYKLYTGLWAKRLSRLRGLISPEQKGFCATDGTGEHSAVLRNAVHQAVNNRNEMVLAWLDLSNAFGSVPHAVIRDTLKAYGFTKRFQAIVRDLYANCSTTVKGGTGITKEIPVRAGTKQGDPISPLLFNVCLEPVLRKFRELFPEALKVQGLPLRILAFADDLVIVAKNAEEMQKMMDTMAELMTAVGLTFNPKKCATMHLKSGMIQDVAYFVDESEVRALTSRDTYEYLGIEVGKNIRSDMYDLAQKAMKELEAIKRSKLAPWQKIDAIKTFVITKMIYEIKQGDPLLKDLGEIDKAIRRVVKNICNLPDLGTPADYLYGSRDQGCLGILSLKDEYHLQSVAQVGRLMYSEDREINDFFRTIWFGTTWKWVKGEPCEADLICFLNGDTSGDFHSGKSGSGGESHGMMTRLRRSMRRFQRFFKKFEFDVVENELVLKVQKLDDDTETVLNVKEKKVFYTKLRAQVSENYVAQLVTKKSRGKVIAALRTQKVSSRFLRDGFGLTFSSWRFVHRARLDLTSLNNSEARRRTGEFIGCRNCDYEKETLPHVLCHCKYQLGTGITKRHNAALERIVDALPRRKEIDVRVNRRGIADKKRPDIVVIDHKRKSVCIADVCCPFDNSSEAINAATERKISKYTDEAEAYRKRGFTVHNGAITIGALGTWCPRNYRTMELLGINKRTAQKMAPWLIGEVIELSKNVFWTHILKEKYDPPNNIYNPDSPYGANAVSQ